MIHIMIIFEFKILENGKYKKQRKFFNYLSIFNCPEKSYNCIAFHVD